MSVSWNLELLTASYFSKFKQATLEMLRAQGGIIGWTSTLDPVCHKLLEYGGATT